jgi:predicted GNAT family acetyltransferase
MPQVLGWVKAFYAETLNTTLPENISAPQSTTSPTKVFVWENANQPVAMGLLTTTGESCRLNLIYVPPNLRGNGFGKAIVCALAALARENALLPMLYASAKNTTARKLYASLGFQEAERLAP